MDPKSKVLDDVLDAITYLVFVYCKLKKYKVGEALWEVFENYNGRKSTYMDAWQGMSVDELLAGARLKTARIAEIWARVSQDFNQK
ncbi:MAG: hypothetical protein QXU87_04100 [Candidatus Caldarchaeum sp.]